MRSAQSHLQSMSTDLGIDLKADSKARRLLPQALAVPTGNINPATVVTPVPRRPRTAPDDATMVMPAGERPGAAAARRTPARRRAGRLERPHAGAGGGHLQRDQRAGRRQLQAERGAAHHPADACTTRSASAAWCSALRDPKTGVITGRLGLGAPASALSAQFRVDVNPNGPVDLLSVACKKAADTLISDASADNVRTRLPTWLQREADARSFVLLPMTMKSAPFALIYADCATRRRHRAGRPRAEPAAHAAQPGGDGVQDGRR